MRNVGLADGVEDHRHGNRQRRSDSVERVNYGGSPAFNGSNLQSNGDSANPEYPSAFVFDNSLAILSAAGTLPGPLYQLEIDVVAWNPPATTGPEVLVWFNSTSCSETDEIAILGTPAP